jgi:hypothetical protein
MRRLICRQTKKLIFIFKGIQQHAEHNAGNSVTVSCLVNEIQKAVIPLTGYKIQILTGGLANKSLLGDGNQKNQWNRRKNQQKKILKFKIYTKKQRRRQLF